MLIVRLKILRFFKFKMIKKNVSLSENKKNCGRIQTTLRDFKNKFSKISYLYPIFCLFTASFLHL